MPPPLPAWPPAAPPLPLLAILLGVAAAHFLFAWATPDPRLWGDEEHYAALARDDVAQGTTSLLPGALRFEHRPEFGSRVWAQLATPEITPAYVVDV